jgi:hypothetical protein
MVTGIIVVVLIILGFLLSYSHGFTRGIRHETSSLLKAFETIQPPNWQSLPVNPGEDAASQVASNKQYVQAFRLAKEIIGEELITNRSKAVLRIKPKKGL